MVKQNFLIKISRLMKNQCFDKNSYSLKEQINKNSKIMILIGQYSASLQILQALVVSFMLVASFTLKV